ncbi:MAG TPA: MFS transporter [Ignavibacteriales bacterium]|nr:MFS transporter [Ignavibacteriales bacterium]
MAFKRLPRQVIILSMVSLFTDVASEMLYPVTPIFLTHLGATMAAIGLIEGIAEITAGLLKGYFGVLSDKLGRRSIFIVVGYGLSGLVKPLPGLIQNFGAILFSRVTDRVGKGVRTAPRDALLAGYSDGNTGAIFGFHRAMDTLGAAIGPLGALLLLAIFPGNYPIIYLIAFIPSVIAIGFTLTVKDKPVEAIIKQKGHYLEFWHKAPRDYKVLVVLFTLFSLVNSSDVFLILKSRSIAGSDSLAIFGYVFYNVVYASFSYPAGILSDKIGKKNVLVIGLLVFSTVYLGFGISESFILMWAFFALYGIYAAATEGVTKAWVSDLIRDENRGSAIGLLTMLSSLAMMLGSVITGELWDLFGSSVPFMITSIVSFVVAVILFFFKNTAKK